MNNPQRVLVWSDIILDLQDLLAESDAQVYIVGGAVRDAFLRHPIKDVDIATPNSGIKLARQIANALNGDFYPLDRSRDVGRAIVNTPDGKVVFDVAKFRGDTLEADLRDRDFTINAMAVNLRDDLNNVIDPTGGEQDLQAKVLRRCSPASLFDDPIRSLRAVRQSVKLKLRIDPETSQDIRSVALRLRESSPERVRDEFFNMLDAPRPIVALRVAHTLGLIEPVLPGITLGGRWDARLKVVQNFNMILEAISPRRTEDILAQFTMGAMVMVLAGFRAQLEAHVETTWANDRTHHALLLLAALLIFENNEQLESYTELLRLSNHEVDRLTKIQRYRHRFDALADTSAREIYRFWRDLGVAGIDVILLSLALQLADDAEFSQDAWLVRVERANMLFNTYFNAYAQAVDPPMLIDGNQLMRQLGLKPSPIIGEILELIREAQVTGEISSIDDALNLARLRLRQNGFSGH